jgi:hypothetical protein
MAKRNHRTPVAVQRERLAQEAARLMMEHGIRDFRQAKRKAAQRLAIAAAGALPSNVQIQERLAERQRIFEGAEHTHRIDRLRRIAADVMQHLAEFEPRLVGPVLAGTATVNTHIDLHLFTDTPEHVAAELDSRRILFKDAERRFKYGGGQTVRVAAYEFRCDGETVVAAVFPEKGMREAPLSPVDGRPMARAARPKLLTLFE